MKNTIILMLVGFALLLAFTYLASPIKLKVQICGC